MNVEYFSKYRVVICTWRCLQLGDDVTMDVSVQPRKCMWIEIKRMNEWMNVMNTRSFCIVLLHSTIITKMLTDIFTQQPKLSTYVFFRTGKKRSKITTHFSRYCYAFKVMFPFLMFVVTIAQINFAWRQDDPVRRETPTLLQHTRLIT